MERLYIKTVKPNKMTEKQKDDYSRLHKKHLTLDDDYLIQYLLPRDRVILFYEKTSHQLVATIGIQLIFFDNYALIYFGNVLIEQKYKHENCISHTSAKHVLKMFLRHPFRSKYCCGLASSSGSLEYSLKHRPSWPNPDEVTPMHVTKIMIQTLQKVGIEQFRIENGNVITYNLSNKINGDFHAQKSPKLKLNSFFHRINPGSELGEQVFFLNPFTLKNALDLAIHGLHANLIKRPKLYHKIQKKKDKKPFYTAWLILRCMMIVKISELLRISKY